MHVVNHILLASDIREDERLANIKRRIYARAMHFYTPDLSGRIMVWRGRLSICLSVRLSTKLVNTIQTEPFQLGPSNLVHLLLMTRGRTLLIFKVRGQRSRSP